MPSKNCQWRWWCQMLWKTRAAATEKELSPIVECTVFGTTSAVDAAERSRCQDSTSATVCCCHGVIRYNWNQLAICLTVGIDQKITSHTQGTLRNDTSGYELSRWQTVENNWINVTWLDHTTYETIWAWKWCFGVIPGPADMFSRWIGLSEIGPAEYSVFPR